jgi:hypothetical protein
LRKAAAEVVAVRPKEVRVCARAACVSIRQHTSAFAADVVAFRPTAVRICGRGGGARVLGADAAGMGGADAAEVGALESRQRWGRCTHISVR